MLNEFVYADGSVGWFELRITRVQRGLFIMSLDVTAQQRAELGLRRQLNKLDALRAIDLAILSTTDSRVALKTVVQETRAQLRVDGALISIVDNQSRRLTVASHAGFEWPPDPSGSVAVGEGLAGRAALERRTLCEPQWRPTESMGRVDWFSARERTRAAYATPLVAKGLLLGVLLVDSSHEFDANAEWIAFLEALAGQAAIAIDAGRLCWDLQRAHADLTLAYDRTIEGWSRALDLRDRETEGHTARVASAVLALAEQAGISEAERIHICRGALLHDIGKMAIPDTILLKPSPLTHEEWRVMREHPRTAYNLLAPIAYLRPALDIPLCHHERWDGSGYPRGLQGEEIPLHARMFAVVDVWDALRSDRPYRPRWRDADVLDYIHQQAGVLFDPEAVELFMQVAQRWPALAH
jgi:HD-GYP domain-containing protein (c-di-GMP phosphodiesterase class II)